MIDRRQQASVRQQLGKLDAVEVDGTRVRLGPGARCRKGIGRR